MGWIGRGRSESTRVRAGQIGLVELDSTAEAIRWADVAISVCPPHAALDVARSVLEAGPCGCFADLNAIAPRRVREIASLFEGTRTTVVDGSLIGPPPRRAARVRLHLSGEPAGVAILRRLFSGGQVESFDLGPELGRASALKVAYALYTKGSLALAATAAALAQGFDVLGPLDEEWERMATGSPGAHLHRSSAAAWRWCGEMDEIAAACDDAGLDPAMPEAAASLYRRWERHRDDREVSRRRLLEELRRTHQRSEP